jgi:hypothetical protein
MLAAAVGLMLNVGCEDSELSRLLGLSKKKNDAVVQPQESSNNSAVENSEAKESESKESGSGDGTQSNYDNSNQNGEGTSNTQNNNDGSAQNGEGTSDAQNGNDNSSQSSSLPQTQSGGNANGQANGSSTQNNEGTSNAQNNNDSSNQDGNLQQVQSDGSANGQTNDGESQTPAIQAVDISQAQSPETPAGIQPMDIDVPSGKNYIKVLQISGTKHPNDLGYAGTWEYFDPTPVGTERIKYGTSNPADIDEVGIWEFQMIQDGNVTTAFNESLTIVDSTTFSLSVKAAVINAGIISVSFSVRTSTPTASAERGIFYTNMISSHILATFPVVAGNIYDFYAYNSVSLELTMNSDGLVRLYGGTIVANTTYYGALSYPVAKNVQKGVIEKGAGMSIVWIKTAPADTPTYGRNNFWGRTK